MERRAQADPVEAVQRGGTRARRHRPDPAVEHERAQVADRGGRREGASHHVDADSFEGAALDPAPKHAVAHPGGADLARCDDPVLTCREVRQPAEFVCHAHD